MTPSGIEPATLTTVLLLYPCHALSGLKSVMRINEWQNTNCSLCVKKRNLRSAGSDFEGKNITSNWDLKKKKESQHLQPGGAKRN